MATPRSENHAQSAQKPLSTTRRISIACEANDIPALSSAIADCANVGQILGTPSPLTDAVKSAIQHGNSQILRWLVDNQGADLDIAHISPFSLARNPSIEFLQFFLDRGWDINTPGGLMHKQERIMQMLCSRDDGIYVPWCLAHGARIFSSEDLEREPSYNPEVVPCPPILDSLVAGGGTVANFQLLQKHGATPGQRTLHLAARHAAIVAKSRYEKVEGDTEVEDRPAVKAAAAAAAAWQMLRFLVEDLCMDINAPDTLTPIPGDYHGTPIAYAANVGDGYGAEEVVKYLLEKRADPRIQDSWGCWDAISRAERARGTEITRIMRDWVASKLEN